MADNNIIGDLFHQYVNPAYLHITKWDAEPTPGEMGADLLKKFIGGVAIAASIEGGRRLADKMSPVDEDKHKRAIKDYISTKYISIPSEKEVDVDEELRKESAEKNARDGEDESSPWVGGARALVGSGIALGKTLTNPRLDPFYLPASIAVLMAGLMGGHKVITSRLDRKEKKNISEDVEDINRDIGRLVQEEYTRTRGEKTAQQGEEEEEDRVNIFSMGGQLLNTLAVIGFLTGTTAGFLKGRSQNPSVVMHKKLTDVIKRNQAVYDAPKIIVPRSLTGQGLESKDKPHSQERVELEELNL